MLWNSGLGLVIKEGKIGWKRLFKLKALLLLLNKVCRQEIA
jgi:hypothetical protein